MVRVSLFRHERRRPWGAQRVFMFVNFLIPRIIRFMLFLGKVSGQPPRHNLVIVHAMGS